MYSYVQRIHSKHIHICLQSVASGSETDYFLFKKKYISLRPYSQPTSILKTKAMAGKLTPGWLNQMIKVPVPKCFMYFSGCPCVSRAKTIRTVM